ncbi:hypothetical protein Tco_0342374, partial [Tanacetum coccineum]
FLLTETGSCLTQTEPNWLTDLRTSTGNPNNTNGWIEADVPLLGERGEIGERLGAEVDEPLVDPVIDKIAEPIIEVEEQMVALVMDMEKDLAMLFGVEDDSSDDDLRGQRMMRRFERWTRSG